MHKNKHIVIKSVLIRSLCQVRRFDNNDKAGPKFYDPLKFIKNRDKRKRKSSSNFTKMLVMNFAIVIVLQFLKMALP